MLTPMVLQVIMLTKGLDVPRPTIAPSTWQRATAIYRSAAKDQVYVEFGEPFMGTWLNTYGSPGDHADQGPQGALSHHRAINMAEGHNSLQVSSKGPRLC